MIWHQVHPQVTWLFNRISTFPTLNLIIPFHFYPTFTQTHSTIIKVFLFLLISLTQFLDTYQSVFTLTQKTCPVPSSTPQFLPYIIWFLIPVILTLLKAQRFLPSLPFKVLYPLMFGSLKSYLKLCSQWPLQTGFIQELHTLWGLDRQRF